MNFSTPLLEWYQQNHRKLPWRDTRNPYLIWISEIILQQTRVKQGYEYYLRFIERFPDIKSLAEAEEEEVLKLWQGLGYYSRARNIFHAAHQIMNEFNGVFPADYHDIIKLKGIGDYSASAIASIAFKQVYPVIDGNVLRLISRVYGISTPIDSSDTRKQIKTILNELIDKQHPDIFNQAMMELGAMVCTPKAPDCNLCPLQLFCYAFEHKKTADFPVKGKKITTRTRYFYYLSIKKKIKESEYTYLNKRTKNDIWKNMYDFPLIEIDKETDINENVLEEIKKLLQSTEFIIKSVSQVFKHKLTHQCIFARFIEIEIKKEKFTLNNYIEITIEKMHKFPIPKLMDNYIKSLQPNENQ